VLGWAEIDGSFGAEAFVILAGNRFLEVKLRLSNLDLLKAGVHVENQYLLSMPVDRWNKSLFQTRAGLWVSCSASDLSN
jgi:hypothetical protein